MTSMKRPSKWFEIWVIALPLTVVGVPVLNLVALGPIAFLYESGWISGETLSWMVAPTFWAAERGWWEVTVLGVSFCAGG